MMEKLERWKPAVPRVWLYLLSGLMWSGVGLMLCTLAYGWLLQVQILNALLLATAGVLLGTAIYRFGFLGLAIKNIHRIQVLPKKACLFAFQEWKSYPLIAVMIMLGITLRHSPRALLERELRHLDPGAGEEPAVALGSAGHDP